MSTDIDIEKIRELNESLSELTGTVNVAEKAVERIVERLGFGDKLKKKAEERAEAEGKATTSIDKSTEAIDEERKKREKSARDQADQFKKELGYRKVAFDANGELISTAVQLSKAQRDTIKLADKLNQKEREKLAYKDDPGKTVSGLTDKFSASGAVLKGFNDQILSLTSSSTALTLSYLGAKAGLTGLMDATSAMAKSLYKGERGAMVTANAFTSLTDAIAPFLKALGPIVSIIANFHPVGRGLKILAWGATALGFAAEKSADALKVMAQQNDDLFKSFNALSESGLTTAEGMNGVFDQLQTLGMTVAEIDKFNAIYKTNSRDLKLFGSTAADGAQKFAEVAGTLYKSDLGEKLELLGVTADQQREHTLRYMSQQTRMGLSLGKTQEQLITGSKLYIEELDRLAMLTGTNRKEQEEAREAMLKIEDLRAAQFEAEQRSDTKRAEELERYAKAAAAIYKFDPRGAKGLAEYGAAGGPTGADSSAAMLTYGKGINAIKQGKSTEDIILAMSESAKTMLKTTSTTRRIGGDVSGMLSGKFPDMVDFVKSMDAARELQKQQGGSLKDALEKIQQEKEKGLDKDTKNTVEAGRKGQAAAMTMDSVVKSFNISAKLNAEATDKFNDAVNKFSETVGAKKPVGGVPQTSGTGQPVVNAAPPISIATSNRANAEEAKVEATKRLESAKPGSDEAKQAQKDLEKARSRVDQTIKIEDTSKTNESLARLKKEGFGAKPVPPTEQKDKAKEPVVIPGKTPENTTKAPTPVTGKTPENTTKESAPLPSSVGENKAKEPVLGTSKAPTNIAKEPVVIPGKTPEVVKEKHSAASLKQMGLPLKEGDVQLEGKELDPKIIDIAKKTKEIPGFNVFTSFNDKFHNEPNKSASHHTTGKAFDFKLNYKPTIEQGKEIVKMLKDLGAGYVKDEYNFPSSGSNGEHIHVQLAEDGGEFKGPKSGYPVMLHGEETVLNEKQKNKLTEKLIEVEKKPVEKEIPALTKTSSNTQSSDPQVVAMLQEFTNVMETKMDAMIDVLNNGNDISGKILTYSMA